MAAQKSAKPVKKSNKPSKISRPGLLHNRLFIPAVIFMIGITGVGAYVLTSSSAATGYFMTCTIYKSPTVPVKGKAFQAKIVYKNTGTTVFNGYFTPYVGVGGKLYYQSRVSNIAVGASTSRTILVSSIPSSGSFNVVVSPIGAPSSYNKYQMTSTCYDGQRWAL